jgi:uridylate kinase
MSNPSPKEKIVIKLSGSIFGPNTKYTTVKRYADLLIELNDSVQPIVITGGGKIARHYIELARSLNGDEATLDALGIEVSRLNGRLLLTGLGNIGYPEIPETLEDIAVAVEFNKVVISGGLHPGQSTNATSALISEKVKASKFINATDVAGIYDKDPNTNSRARLFSELSVAECIELLSRENSQAGTYELMDIVALKVIERSKIPTIVTKADVDTLKDIILNGSTIGTKITS